MQTGFTLLCLVLSRQLDASTCDIFICRTLQTLHKDKFYSLLSSVVIEVLGIGHTSSSVPHDSLEGLKGINITSGFSFNDEKNGSH